MRKSKKQRPLTLSTETLLVLNERQLGDAAGGKTHLTQTCIGCP